VFGHCFHHVPFHSQPAIADVLIDVDHVADVILCALSG
jgi:hypothetical protein